VLPFLYEEFLHPGADAHDHDGHVLFCARAWKLQKLDDLASVHSAFITARDLTIAGRFVFGDKTCRGRSEERRWQTVPTQYYAIRAATLCA
jgi:hypothetical protein